MEFDTNDVPYMRMARQANWVGGLVFRASELAQLQASYSYGRYGKIELDPI